MKSRRFLVLAVLPLLGACASTSRLSSSWRQEPVVVDGKAGEWSEGLQSLAEAGLSIGVKNDAQRLYLCLSSADPQVQAQILGTGLILWFDVEGKKQKSFGIQYPIGDLAGLKDGTGFPNRRRPGEAPNGPGSGEGPDRMRTGVVPDENRRERLAGQLAGMKEKVRFFSSSDALGWTMPRSELRGVELEMSLEGPRLIYEMSLPLQDGEGLAFVLKTAGRSEIAIGLETPELERPERGEGMEDGMGGGPGMGGGRGMGGPGMGRPGGPVGGRPEPIETWVVVSLSPAP